MTHGAQDGDKAHSICGTAEYMSPEMVEHSGYSFMSEVWSFGVFIYEMLTGATPFECDAPQYDSQERKALAHTANKARRNAERRKLSGPSPTNLKSFFPAGRRGGPSGVVTFAQRIHTHKIHSEAVCCYGTWG
jgi:serine/threonine protein kinase